MRSPRHSTTVSPDTQPVRTIRSTPIADIIQLHPHATVIIDEEAAPCRYARTSQPDGQGL